jgi:hypothetical protein
VIAIVNERPLPAEYHAELSRYIARVEGADATAVLRAQAESFPAALATVPADRVAYRYAEGKWSVREVVGHMIDSERIFGYRALCIARGETGPLPGFDEQAYMSVAPFETYSMADLIAEFRSVRATTLSFFEHLTEAAWRRTGTANGKTVSVRAIAFVLAGHVEHHLSVLRERYGV